MVTVRGLLHDLRRLRRAGRESAFFFKAPPIAAMSFSQLICFGRLKTINQGRLLVEGRCASAQPIRL